MARGPAFFWTWPLVFAGWALLFVAPLVVLGVVVHRLLGRGSAPAALAGTRS